MNSPGYLAQLVHQNNANSQLISGGNKKRRLSNQGELQGESASPDGQMIKYQPLMTEAAKLMVMQILTLESSPRLESYSKPDNTIQLGNFHLTSDALDGSMSSSSGGSGVTFQEVPLSSGMPYVTTNSVVSEVCSSSAFSEIQSPPIVSDPKHILPVFPEGYSQANIGFPGHAQVQGILAYESIANIPGMRYAASEVESALVQSIAGVDGIIPLELEKFSDGADIDVFSEG